MKHSARLKSLIELLDTILDENNRSPADDLFVNYCRNRRYIGSKDRQFLSSYFFGILRFYNSLSISLKGARTARMLALLYWYNEDESFEELYDEGESLYGIPLPNEHEEDIIKRASSVFKENPFHIPNWTDCLFDHFLDKKKEVIETLFTEAPFDIRINPLLTDRETVLKKLAKEKIRATPTTISPYGIRLKERIPLQSLKLWTDGHIEIQDEGAQVVSILCDVKQNHHVLDYCAGAGGKTLMLAALMQNKGHIIATDLHKYRLEQGQKRYRRSQIHTIQIKDINDTKWWKRHQNFFDRVLIDVPCSGSGTWRRNPDLKLRFQKQDLHELLSIQTKILEQSKNYVKTGGYLIYVTCSLWECENQKQIHQFLEKNPDFKLVNVQQKLKDVTNIPPIQSSIINEENFLQFTPFDHDMDGFFISILEKI